jgi:hypothetical protein
MDHGSNSNSAIKQMTLKKKIHLEAQFLHLHTRDGFSTNLITFGREIKGTALVKMLGMALEA